jgi:hypothetical protein
MTIKSPADTAAPQLRRESNLRELTRLIDVCWGETDEEAIEASGALLKGIQQNNKRRAEKTKDTP